MKSKTIRNKLESFEYVRQRIKFYTKIDVLDTIRKRENVYARIVFCKIMRDDFYETLGSIGNFLDKDHTTVLHSIRSFETLELYDDVFYKCYKYLQMELEEQNFLLNCKDFGSEEEQQKQILKIREVIKLATKEYSDEIKIY
jgi:hypothetical protein